MSTRRRRAAPTAASRSVAVAHRRRALGDARRARSTSSSREEQVVRAGLAASRRRRAAAPRRPARRRGRVETWTMCSAQPVSSAKAIARPIASSSATDAGATPRSRARVRPGAERAVSASFSACTATRSAEPRADRHALVERDVVGVPELVDAAVGHERLEADHAALGELLEPVDVARDEPAPEPEVDAATTRARPRSFASKAGAVDVGGDEFSGMSKNAVKPPAASAALPVASPSQSVRPGSLKWTCGSSAAGKTCRPPASISSRAAGELGLDRRDRAVERRRCRRASTPAGRDDARRRGRRDRTQRRRPRAAGAAKRVGGVDRDAPRPPRRPPRPGGG